MPGPGLAREDLVERWWTPAGQDLAAEVRQFLLGRRPLPAEVPFHDGLADLRGLGFPPIAGGAEPRCREPLHVDRLTWRGLDLSAAWLPRVRGVSMTIRECRFDHGECRQWRLEQSEVVGVSFVGADLSRSTFGGPEAGAETRIEASDFDNARLHDVRFLGGQLTGTTFVDADLDGATTLRTDIRNCVFAGPMGRVVFDGRRASGDPSRMVATVLADADLSQVEVRGYRLEGVQPPDGYLIIDDYPRVVEQIVEVLRDATDPDELAVRSYFDSSTVEGWSATSSALLLPRILRDALGESATARALRLLLGSTKESRATTVHVEAAEGADGHGVTARLIASRDWRPPGLQQSDVVDLVAQSPGDEATLFLIERRPWGTDPQQGAQLLAKVNHYIRYLADGGLQRDYPTLADLPIVFRLECASEPPDGISALLGEIQRELEPADVRFETEVDSALSVEATVSDEDSSGRISSARDSREAHWQA